MSGLASPRFRKLISLLPPPAEIVNLYLYAYRKDHDGFRRRATHHEMMRMKTKRSVESHKSIASEFNFLPVFLTVKGNIKKIENYSYGCDRKNIFAQSTRRTNMSESSGAFMRSFLAFYGFKIIIYSPAGERLVLMLKFIRRSREEIQDFLFVAHIKKPNRQQLSWRVFCR
jgi:hypothetical protein